VPAPDPNRVAALYLAGQRSKTAGEVIFKKDRSGDVDSWAYTDVPPSQREIPRDFNYSPRHQKPLAQVLRSTLAALGYVLMAYNRFAKLKSSRLSPDGALGGRGYIQKIQDMRKQYMNCVEALSALSDTLHDELNAPHWALMSRQEEDEDKNEMSQLIDDVQVIREDPQEWAEEQTADDLGDEEGEEDEEDEGGEEVEIVMDGGFGEAMGGGPDERTKKNEENPIAWMHPPSGHEKRGSGARASRKQAGDRSASEIRLALAAERMAAQWIAKHKDQLPGGLADRKEPSDFDPSQLKKGIKVEMEHTDDRTKAQEIAMDHLTEDPKYYDKLETIEEGHR
jgi:hypothetical protein